MHLQKHQSKMGVRGSEMSRLLKNNYAYIQPQGGSSCGGSPRLVKISQLGGQESQLALKSAVTGSPQAVRSDKKY